jgi:DNA-binding beta-propeller fold protein YncE
MRRAIILIILGAMVSCLRKGTEEPTLMTGVEKVYVINGLSETVSIIIPDSFEILKDVFETGSTPNFMLINYPLGYIVNSGHTILPSIQVFDVDKNSVTRSIPLPEGSNPWAVALYDGKLYVTGFATDRVYILDEENYELVNEVSVGKGPVGITPFGNLLLVVCSGFDLNTFEYGEGSLYILEIDSINPAEVYVVDSIKVGINPQTALVDGNGRIHILASGRFGENEGKIYLIDPLSGYSITDSLHIGGFPTSHTLKDGVGYVTDIGGRLISYDENTFTILKEIVVPSGGMGIAVDGKGRVFLAVFSSDGMNYVRVYDSSLDSLLFVYETGDNVGSQFIAIYEP